MVSVQAETFKNFNRLFETNGNFEIFKKINFVDHKNGLQIDNKLFTSFSLFRNLDYVCKENGRCIVDVTRRNQCQACRFSKCLEVNMRKDGTYNGRISYKKFLSQINKYFNTVLPSPQIPTPKLVHCYYEPNQLILPFHQAKC